MSGLSEEKVNIHKGHRQRVKDEFEQSGLSSFSDVRALELLLFYAVPRIDVNPLAHTLLDKYGSLYGVLSAPLSELKNVDGIGQNAAILIKLAAEIHSKAVSDHLKREKHELSSSAAAGDYVLNLLGGSAEEQFLLICLDPLNQVLKADVISSGNVNSVSVDVRDVVHRALVSKATSVILAHNHPSGGKEPSREDIVLTSGIRDALNPLGIAVHDHIIAAGDGWYSFAANGLL